VGLPALKCGAPACRCVHVIRPSFLLRRPGAMTIAVVAVVDVAYRLLLRASVRRMLGMRPQP